MEIEKSHDSVSASRGVLDAGHMAQSKSWKPHIQGSWWYNSQSRTDALRTWVGLASLSPGVQKLEGLEFSVQGQEKAVAPGGRKGKELFFHLFCSENPTDRMMPAHIEARSSPLNPSTHMPILCGNASQTHQEVMFCQASKYSLLQPSWHLK